MEGLLQYGVELSEQVADRGDTGDKDFSDTPVEGMEVQKPLYPQGIVILFPENKSCIPKA